MKVKVKKENKRMIGELQSGECFLYEDTLCIATNELSDGQRRCVELETGVMRYFVEDVVTPVDAEVVVHD